MARRVSTFQREGWDFGAKGEQLIYLYSIKWLQKPVRHFHFCKFSGSNCLNCRQKSGSFSPQLDPKRAASPVLAQLFAYRERAKAAKRKLNLQKR